MPERRRALVHRGGRPSYSRDVAKGPAAAWGFPHVFNAYLASPPVKGFKGSVSWGCIITILIYEGSGKGYKCLTLPGA